MNRLDTSLFILTINGETSSIKFALFRDADSSMLMTCGMLDRIGRPQQGHRVKRCGRT